MPAAFGASVDAELGFAVQLRREDEIRAQLSTGWVALIFCVISGVFDGGRDNCASTTPIDSTLTVIPRAVR